MSASLTLAQRLERTDEAPQLNRQKGIENGGGWESPVAWWGTAASKLGPSLTPTPFPQVSANGNVLRSEIVGSIKMRVFLSGMPELRLGLNDKVLFDNTGREYQGHGAVHRAVSPSSCILGSS